MVKQKYMRQLLSDGDLLNLIYMLIQNNPCPTEQSLYLIVNQLGLKLLTEIQIRPRPQRAEPK